MASDVRAIMRAYDIESFLKAIDQLWPRVPT